MFKRALIVILLCSPWLGAASGGCSSADRYRTSKPMLGVVELGPFPKANAGVAGYNLYLSNTQNGEYEKINDIPVGGGSKIMVPMLNPGQEYFFKMTSVSEKDPSKESAPSAPFKRKAVAK